MSSILSHLDGVLWLLITLVPLLILQRRLHKEVQSIFLLITRRIDIAVTLFSISFFPGILLHEGSHYVMARFLGVHTGEFSLVPKPTPDQKLQLGYVETAKADWFRDAFIGMAPLLTGGVLVAYIGFIKLDFMGLKDAFDARGVSGFLDTLRALIVQPDFWVWFYLALVVSSTMLPSESDRRAWFPLGIILITLLCVSLFAGAGPWLEENLAAPFNKILRTASLVFAVSASLHFVLVPLLTIIRHVLSRLTGMEVVL